MGLLHSRGTLITSPGYLSNTINMSHFSRTISGSGSIRRVPFAVVAIALLALLGLTPAIAQETIEDAREQRDRARVDELRARTALDILDAEFEDLEAAFDAADELVQLHETRMRGVETQLALVQARVNHLEVAIEWAEYDQERLDDEIASLAVQAYLGEAEDDNLLSHDDFNEAMTKQAVLDAVEGAGDDILDTARTAADQYEELLAAVEQEKAEIERLETGLESEREELLAAREVRQGARDAMDSRRQEWLGKIDELEAEEEGLTEFIRAEQRRIDRQNAIDAFDAAQSSEGYVWPTAGGIGSYFGNRVHPVLGYSRLHGGIDIGGLMGQPIWAAKEGVVILAGVKGGYGNTIIIDHGNGYSTLYGHQSSYEVTQGQYVETGQHIGNVGSTGLSTGPHLHFEVRINGGVVDPLPYLPPR